jgi:hypothetical protein
VIPGFEDDLTLNVEEECTGGRKQLEGKQRSSGIN